MDVLVSEAIKQIALEGRRGCALSRLWSLLEEELPIAGCEKLNAGIRRLVWTSLVNIHRDEFGIYVSRQIAEADGLALEAGEAETQMEEDSCIVTKVRVYQTTEIVKDLSFLETRSPTLIAIEACRFHFLGIRDAVTCRFKLNEKQIETLEEIGKARRKGCLQSDLARTVGIAHKNFFFVMKQLEGRQLAVRNPVILNRAGEADAHVSATNIIHLPCFAPDIKLEQFQAFKMVGDSEFEEHDEDREAGVYRMRDDASWMRQISQKISEAENMIALEFDIKQALGFRHTKGHRLWRRLKKKMVDLGLIKSFVASVSGKPSVCIELIEKDFEKWLEEQRRQENEESLRGPESSIAAEQSLNRQLFQMIVDAGPQGVSTKDLFEKLRLNSKRNMNRLKAMQGLFGIQIHAVSSGKSAVNQCFAPVSAMQRHLAASTAKEIPRPTVAAPAGGWMMAVKRAAVIGSEFAQDTHDHEGEPVELPTEDESPLPSYPDPNDEAQKKMRSYLFSHLVSSRADFRCRHLLDKVNAEGFLLRSHIGAYFRELEVTHGLSSDGKGPDRKTIDRVIHRLVTEDKIKKMKISMWTKSGGQPRLVDVLFKKDLEVTDDVLRQIRQTDEVFATTSRQRCLVRFQSEFQQTLGQSLPVIDNLTRLPPLETKSTSSKRTTEQGLAFHQIHKNGFVNARLTRAKLLHCHICLLVGLGGQPRALGAEQCLAPGLPPASDHGLQRDTASVGGESSAVESKTYRFARRSREIKQEPLERKQAEQIALSMKDYSFTPRQLWDSLPASLYLQVVGSVHASDEISSMRESSQKMNELSDEKSELLVDRLSRNRLADLLDLLCRLKLIESSIAVGESKTELTESARFIAHDTGVLEEPDDTEGDGVHESVEKKQVQCALDTEKGLEMYWLRMEFVFSQQRQLIDRCFPATAAPEVCSTANWSTAKSISTSKWLTVQQLMDSLEPLNWKKCDDIAKKMGISYHQVIRMNRDRCRKKLLKSTPLPVPTLQEKTRPKRERRSTIKKPKTKRPKQASIKSDGAFTGLDSDFDDLSRGETSLVIKEDRSRSGYWYKEEDVDLLSGYYAWLTYSKPSKTGARWTAMVGMPGGTSTSALSRCKRRLRYLQKQEHIKELFADLEDVTLKLYQQRWERVMLTDDHGCTIVNEGEGDEMSATGQKRKLGDSSLPSEISEQEEPKSVGMDVFRIDAFTARTRYKGMNVLDIMLETCDDVDRDLIQQMKQLIADIAERGPRIFKKEVEKPQASAPGSRPRSIPEWVDLRSSVVSVEKRTKTVGFRLGKERLLTEEEPMTLSVAMAKDFIVSCMFGAHKNKYMTNEMATEMTARFKDEELRKALGLLYKQGWINSGSARYPINLSFAFKKKLTNLWLPGDVIDDVCSEMSALLLGEDMSGLRTDRECTASEMSIGATVAIFSAMAVDGVCLSDDVLDALHSVDSSIPAEMHVKLLLCAPQCSPTGRLAHKRKEGIRRSFSELLRESLLDEEMEIDHHQDDAIHSRKYQKTTAAPRDEQDQSQALSSLDSILLKAIHDAGADGISLGALQRRIQVETEAPENELQSALDDLVARYLLRSFQMPAGNIYTSREKSDRFVVMSPTATEGASQSKDSPIRIWRDHNGNIHEELLQRLQQQILSTVLEHPGVTEEVLVEAVSYGSASSAVELLRLMTKQGLLKTQHIVQSNAASPVASFLTGMPQETESVTRVAYFADLRTCFSRKLPVTEYMNM